MNFVLWLQEPDPLRRLAIGRCELGNVVRAVYHDAFILDWANADSPFLGAMQREQQVTIWMNPTPVLSHVAGTSDEALAEALKGIALHEASHAVYTSPRWQSVLANKRRKAQARRGDQLPRELVSLCANLAEDGWIERQLTARFPGFTSVFAQTVRYFYSDADYLKARTELDTQLEAWRDDPAHFTGGERLISACYTLSILFTRRTDCPWEALPAEVEALYTIATILRLSWAIDKVTLRMAESVRAAEQLFDLLRQWLPADKISQILKKKEGEYREQSSPRGKTRTKNRLSPQQTRQLREIETAEQDGVISASEIAAWETVQSEEGRALLDGKTVRILDSTPEVLPNYVQYALFHDLDTLQARTLEVHRVEAERLRKRVRDLLNSPKQRAWHEMTTGELDDDLLPEATIGEKSIFVQDCAHPHFPLDLVVLIDGSGSMEVEAGEQERWQYAMSACVVLEYALRPLFSRRGVRLRVFDYTSDAEKPGETVLYRHFDSMDRQRSDPFRLGWCYPKAYNADGIALAAVQQEMRKQRHTLRRAVLMIGDGSPNAHEYAGVAACHHVCSERLQLERARIRFTHLHIGDVDEAHLTEMYGASFVRLTTVAELPEAVAKLALRWLRS